MNGRERVWIEKHNNEGVWMKEREAERKNNKN